MANASLDMMVLLGSALPENIDLFSSATNEPLFHKSAVYCTLTNQSQRLTYQLPTLQATARLLVILSVPPGALMYTLATADHTYSLPHVALDWQSLPERLCSRTPASTVLYRTGHSVKNYSFAVVLCVSESVEDIFRLHACRQDSSLFPHLLITTWPSTTADYGLGKLTLTQMSPASLSTQHDIM
ncbi:hypothetical protein J6590_088646 [Homalodisca vitripennis]|nr:hypothetical protein J6590_088646 [Homalodisca vitripennis]